MTLEEKEYQLQLYKERQAVLPEAITSRDKIVDDKAVVTSDVPMAMAVRYRKEGADSCHSDETVEEVSTQEDHSVGETIEMVAIASDSDQAILLSSQLGKQKKVC